MPKNILERPLQFVIHEADGAGAKYRKRIERNEKTEFVEVDGPEEGTYDETSGPEAGVLLGRDARNPEAKDLVIPAEWVSTLKAVGEFLAGRGLVDAEAAHAERMEKLNADRAALAARSARR